MQAAATSNLKQVCLELGGKSPFIVFDDVDVDKVAPLALSACFFNQVTISIYFFPFIYFLNQMLLHSLNCDPKYNLRAKYVWLGLVSSFKKESMINS